MDVETHPLWGWSCPLAMPYGPLLKSRWRSHESGEKPHPMGGDSPIQAISLHLNFHSIASCGILGACFGKFQSGGTDDNGWM